MSPSGGTQVWHTDAAHEGAAHFCCIYSRLQRVRNVPDSELLNLPMNKTLQRWMLRNINFWPPFFAAGIRVTRRDGDMKAVDVEMKLRFWNRNYAGTQHYGGSLYSMADPFYMLMLMKIWAAITRLGQIRGHSFPQTRQGKSPGRVPSDRCAT